MEHKLILAGLGGQGVVFLTRLLSHSAVLLGKSVIVSETHGMSQRGGSVTSHLKIGGNQAPLIQKGTADVLLALEENEAVRNIPYLRKGGCAFINSAEALPAELGSHLERLNIGVFLIPANRLALELGSSTAANVVLAGFASAHPAVGISLDTLQESLKSLSSRNLDLNLQALSLGFKAGESVLQG